MTFKSWSELESYVKKACRKAVDDTVAYFLLLLQAHIEEDFYNQITPKRYIRSMQFYESAIMQMVQSKANEILGKVYMNPDLMQRRVTGKGSVAYDNGFNGHQQLQLANRGSHGGAYETGISYWQNFLEDFNRTVEGVLLGFMADYGLPLKKA